MNLKNWWHQTKIFFQGGNSKLREEPKGKGMTDYHWWKNSGAINSEEEKSHLVYRWAKGPSQLQFQQYRSNLTISPLYLPCLRWTFSPNIRANIAANITEDVGANIGANIVANIAANITVDINSIDPAKVLNVRDISEVLSELEEQEEPKEESNDNANKLVVDDEDDYGNAGGVQRWLEQVGIWWW